MWYMRFRSVGSTALPLIAHPAKDPSKLIIRGGASLVLVALFVSNELLRRINSFAFVRPRQRMELIEWRTIPYAT